MILNQVISHGCGGITNNKDQVNNTSNYSNNKKLYKWDGTNIANYNNKKKLYKLNGNTVSVYSTNKKLLKIDGIIPIPILIVLVTGML